MEIRHWGPFTATIDHNRQEIEVREMAYADPLPDGMRERVRKWMLSDLQDYFDQGFILVCEVEL